MGGRDNLGFHVLPSMLCRSAVETLEDRVRGDDGKGPQLCTRQMFEVCGVGESMHSR